MNCRFQKWVFSCCCNGREVLCKFPSLNKHFYANTLANHRITDAVFLCVSQKNSKMKDVKCEEISLNILVGY